MASRTVEDYLKKLYIEQQRVGEGLIAMGRIAERMGVAPGTATAMIKTLCESGLVLYEPRGGTRLTPRGETLALHVLRRHRLVELFLVDVLGLDWSEVHEEAEDLEHAISDKVLDRIDRMLGHPDVDPHGDPIPSADGAYRRRMLTSLAEAGLTGRATIVRVGDQDAEFLQFLHRSGLRPGTQVDIERRDIAADAVTVSTEEGPSVTLGTGAAAKILVEQVK